MKEFIKKILNAIFPGLPTKTAGWISLAFLIVLITAIVVLCVWIKKSGKKNVENVNITKEEPENKDAVVEEEKTEPVEEEKQVETATEKPVMEEKEEVKVKEEQKEEVVMKEEKKTTKQAKQTKAEKVTKTKVEKTEEPKTKKTTSKVAKEEKTEVKAEKKPAKVKEEKKEEKVEEQPTEVEATTEEVKVKNQKYMVIYDKEKKDWVIKKTGAAKASKRCKTKKEALEFVEKYAENQDLNVSIKKKDGKFQKKY